MNKETRQFIWGFICFFIGIAEVSIQVENITYGRFHGADWITFPLTCICLLYGFKLIYKTTE